MRRFRLSLRAWMVMIAFSGLFCSVALALLPFVPTFETIHWNHAIRVPVEILSTRTRLSLTSR